MKKASKCTFIPVLKYQLDVMAINNPCHDATKEYCKLDQFEKAQRNGEWEISAIGIKPLFYNPTNAEELTDLFSGMEIKYMNPHIFSSSNEYIAKFWFQWSWLCIAWHIVALYQSETEEYTGKNYISDVCHISRSDKTIQLELTDLHPKT